ncbi:MAG: hypothetical protein B1H05_03870, partial [Candidatus Cloacimonas sp. 4484_140]
YALLVKKDIHFIKFPLKLDGVGHISNGYGPVEELWDGNFHHIAATYDKVGGENNCLIYVDGFLVDAETLTGSIDTKTSSLTVGGHSYDGNLFEGKIDEVQIWNVALTAQQIRENMCKTLTGNEGGLVAYYNFDNTSGTTLQDFSGNINDGTLQNMDNADWVNSSAFNTWLNTNSSDWSSASNWSRGSVPSLTDNVGIMDYTGGTAPTLSATTVNNFVVDDIFTLGANVTVNGNLILEENLDLNGKTITLGATANLVESSGNLYGTSGTITTTRNLSNIDEDVAGLGAKITTSANMLSTTIIRGHQAQGTLGIKRYYQINPTTNTGLNATLIFNYLESELNGVAEADLKLFKSADGNSWTEQATSSVNTTDNTITLSSIDGFSWWTGAKTGSGPTLPVELSTFTAQFIENTPTLYWTTQSEADNMGWFVYRNDEEDFTTSEKISEFIEGHGTTTQQQSYLYEDNIENPEIGSTYYYWLESIDYSGIVNHYDKVAVITIQEQYDPGGGLIPEPVRHGLLQNEPNPVIESTKISFNLHETAKVELNIYNLKGQLVKSLYSGFASSKTLVWNGKDENGKNLQAGVYLYKLLINGKIADTKKLVLMK